MFGCFDKSVVLFGYVALIKAVLLDKAGMLA
jgi:hypothetical protein